MIVFDTGALIALERRTQRAVQIWSTARHDGFGVLVPGVVVAEWWRGGTDVRRRILTALDVRPVDTKLGVSAGAAIAATPGATVVDALVMALAARTGSVVFTSDAGDLEALRAYFPAVRVLSV